MNGAANLHTVILVSLLSLERLHRPFIQLCEHPASTGILLIHVSVSTCKEKIAHSIVMLIKRLNIYVAVSLVLLWMFCPMNAGSQIIYTVAGDGYLGNVGNNVPAVCAGTPFTSGICLDGKNNLYLTCSNAIRKVDLNTGIITTVAGSDTWGHTGDGGPALAATLQYPYDLCADKNDNIYISEWGGHYIRKINTKTGIISTVAGNGAGGYSGDNGPASGASINSPEGIFTDASGNIYFADTYNSRVRKINAATGIITTIAGTGAPAYSGDGGLAINAGVPYPNDVNIDGAGNVYISETLAGNSARIRKINAATGIVTTIAGNSNLAYSGDGGPATAASLFGPNAVFADKAGNVFISEYDDSRIRKIDGASGIITSIAGTGNNTFAGDGGPAVNASLYYPKGICVDNNGDIYVADHTSGRIRKISGQFAVFPSLQVSLNINAPVTRICAGETVEFSATLTNGGADPQFSWQVNGTTVGTGGPRFSSSQLHNGDVVTCSLVSSVCNNFFTIGSNAITIADKANTVAAVNITASNITICTGQQVVFTAAAINAGAQPAYQWKLNGIVVGTNSSVYASSALANGDKINCTVTVDPAMACGATLAAASNTITMQVNAAQAATLSITPSANNICPGNPVTFTAVPVNAGAAPVYQWKINGLPAGNNASTFTYNRYINNDAVTCEISGQGACLVSPVASPAVIMQVKQVPVVAVVPADTTIAAGTKLHLQAVVPPNGIQYDWKPAALLVNANTLAPETVPLYSNTIFEITVMPANGCAVTAKSSVKLFTKLVMPGAFSPNGDGVNEVFRIPPGTALKLQRFSVYNRFGNQIFTTTDISEGWNGSINGIQKEPGVYVYVVTGTDANGPVLLKGTFLLLR